MTRKDLLEIPCWTITDIMAYYPSIKSKTTAIKMKKIAIRDYDGSVPYGSQFVKRDSILQVFGTTVEREREVINGLQTNN